MSVVIDSNAPYFTEFPMKSAGDAVYMTAEDDVLGHVFAVVYRAHPGIPKLSVILIGAHGTSGYVDMTLDRTSRYFAACKGLAPPHYKSPVRRALAIAALRTYATVDKPLREKLRGRRDESAAGSLGSRFRLVYGKYPGDIGGRVLDAGLICPKRIESSIIDIVYEDSDSTIDQNNELVYLLGEQLEQLFDPLSEYSPEPTERLYTPPVEGTNSGTTKSLEDESKAVQDICEELYLLQAHARGDILDLLQTTLIPLRIEVLKGSFPGLTIARLNSVFPPTIDELFRVNNIFYESLRTALPFGAFEVVKACGSTVPYFFRACMRHEAATQGFSQLLSDLLDEVPEVQRYMQSADIAKIEKIIRNPSHLVSIKRELEKLVSSKNWETPDERRQIDEFYAVAKGTVDSLNNSGATKKDKDSITENGNTREKKLATAGKILGEITQDWPTELEYGWVNRRVVSVFDAVDVLEPMESIRQLHTVFIVFTDSLVVCRPSEPIPATSLSGLHVPSVGDMLMHAMLNEAPLDKNLPPLKVVAWAPILDVHFAAYDKQHLYVFSPGIVGSYKLLQPDSDSSDLVTLLAKAKITTKTQPFHLFKVSGPETTVFSTVQELQGYREEINRTNIALFLSTNITERTLKEFGLVGAVSLHIKGDDETVVLKVVSRMRYSGSFEINKNELRDLVVNELAYLMTLSLSSQNPEMLDVIITSNKLVVNQLIKWACQPDSNGRGHKQRMHHRVRKQVGGPSGTTEPSPPSKPSAKTAASVGKTNTNNINQEDEESEEEEEESRSQLFVIPSDSAESRMPINRSLRKMPANIPPNSRDQQKLPQERDTHNLEKEPLIDVQPTIVSSTSGSSRYTGSQYSEEPYSGPNDLSSGAEEMSVDEAEQRDVDNWYHQLHNSRGDDESLSSEASGQFQRTHSNSSSIQIGGFFDSNASRLYNENAGRAFPRIEDDHTIQSTHRRQETESSFETITSLQDTIDTTDDSFISGNTTISSSHQNINRNSRTSMNNEIDAEDFSYLASLVDATSFNSKMSELERGGVYPDLRETSLVRLGSYIIRNDKGQRDGLNATLSSIPEARIDDKDEEPTPTLHSGKFVAASSSVSSSPIKPSRFIEKSPYSNSVSTNLATLGTGGGFFTPFADVETADWHPKVVKSGTTATVSGLLPGYAKYFDGDDSFDDEAGHEIAKQYLAWAESSGRPVSMLSTRTINEFINEEAPLREEKQFRKPISSQLPPSKSQVSFRRMVMSSSLHTLQLASFIVQVDQRELTSSKEVAKYLQELKEFVTAVYRMRNISVEAERIVRRQLTGYHMLLLKFNCQQLAYGLLEIEWFRRTRVSELQPELIPQLWTFS